MKYYLYCIAINYNYDQEGEYDGVEYDSKEEAEIALKIAESKNPDQIIVIREV